MDAFGEATFDAIVAGTGPGGATVARELSHNGRKVLMLELGGTPKLTGSLLVPARGMRQHRTSGKLIIMRGVTTGGSSLFFMATAFEPDHEMLAEHGVDIRAEVEEARKELPIGPLADELVGPMASRIMESALSLGYDWQKLDKFVDQERCRPACQLCTYGCPHGAKWNARVFVEEAIEEGATLTDQAAVTGVVIENGKAVGVEYTRNKQKCTARAPLVVLSAGGIGTASILRRMGVEEAGCDFFIDPLIMVNGTVGDVKGGRELPMAAGVEMRDERFIMTDQTLPKTLYCMSAAGSGRIDRMLSHSRTLTIMVKVKDELGGRLMDEKTIDKRLSEKDERVFEAGYAAARSILEQAGAKKIFKTSVAGAHPGGTAKIGDVVDANLQTRFQHLYVCDASVIPGECGIPPVLTLIGLGKRLAKHLSVA